MTIVISFDPTDALPVAEKLAKDLSDTWYDTRSEHPLLDVSMVVEAAIEKAETLVVVLSPNSINADSPIHRHIFHAISTKTPIVLLQSAGVDIPTIINDLDAVELNEDWSGVLSSLRTSIEEAEPVDKIIQTEEDPFIGYLLSERSKLAKRLMNLVHRVQYFDTESIADATDIQSYPFMVSATPNGEVTAFQSAVDLNTTRTILIGESGVGKSTLMMAVAYHGIVRRLVDPDVVIPVYVPLYLLNAQTASMNSYIASARSGLIADLLSAIGYEGATALLFDAASFEGKVLFLLDDLGKMRHDLVNRSDEMPLNMRYRLFAYFNQPLFSDLSFIMAGRETDLSMMKRAFPDKDLQGYWLQPQPDAIVDQSLPLSVKEIISNDESKLLSQIAKLPLYLNLLRSGVDDKRDDLAEAEVSTLYEWQDSVIDDYIERRYAYIVSQPDTSLEVDTEELLENMQLVLWDVLTAKSRRDFVGIWEENFVNPLGGAMARLTNEALRKLGLIYTTAQGVDQFIHSHIYRYFIYDELIGRAFEGTSQISEVAVLGLQRFREPLSIPYLTTLLETGDAQQQEDAAIGIGLLGDPSAVKILADNLPMSQPAVGRSIAVSLGRIGDEAAVPTLISQLSAHQSEDVQAHIAWALGEISNHDAAPALKEATENVDWNVCVQSIKALGKLGDKSAVDNILPFILMEDADLRAEALRTLGQLGDEKATSHIVTIVDDPNSEVRATAIRALAQIGSNDAMDYILGALDDEEATVRQAAVEGLSEMGEDVIHQLMQTLKTADEETRYSTAQTLGYMGQAALEPLTACMTDSDPTVRSVAAQALGWVSDPSAMDVLVKGLADDFAEVRANSAWAIGWIGDDKGVTALLNLLDDDDVDVVLNAIDALGSLGDERAIEPLQGLLSDPDMEISHAAESALERLNE